MQQITEDQHYVPIFYLKRFADDQGFLQVLDVKNKKRLRKRAYAGVCYSSFFYGVNSGKSDQTSQDVEKYLEKIEGFVGQRLSHIIERILNSQQIDDNDQYVLSVLVSMLWLRTPRMRSQLNGMKEKMIKQLMSMSPKEMVEKYISDSGTVLSDAEKTIAIESLETGNYELAFNNLHHIRFLTSTLGFFDEGFANVFFQKNLKIYLAHGPKKFITSDNPVFEWSGSREQGWFGPSILERNQYLALTPEILLEFTYPLGSKKDENIILFERIDDDDKTKMFNILITRNCYEFCYTGDEGIFDEMLKRHSISSIGLEVEGNERGKS